MEEIFEKGNSMPENSKSFFDEYLSLERHRKAAFRAQVMMWCKIQQTTFQSWIRERKVPPLPQVVIAQKMQRPQSELFPNP